MNINDALPLIAAENNLTRFDIGIMSREDGSRYFMATAWGLGIGNHDCCSGSGETIEDAISNTLIVAVEKRAIRFEKLQVAA